MALEALGQELHPCCRRAMETDPLLPNRSQIAVQITAGLVPARWTSAWLKSVSRCKKARSDSEKRTSYATSSLAEIGA
eukprot:g47921.t1